MTEVELAVWAARVRGRRGEDDPARDVPLSVLPHLVAWLVRVWDDAEHFADGAAVDRDAAVAELAETRAADPWRVALAWQTRAARAERRYHEQLEINQQQAKRIAQLRAGAA